jgi:hypothetical protein
MFLAAISRITLNSAHFDGADWQTFDQRRPAMTIHVGKKMARRHTRVANESLKVIA